MSRVLLFLALPFLLVGEACFYIADFILGENSSHWY